MNGSDAGETVVAFDSADESLGLDVWMETNGYGPSDVVLVGHPDAPAPPMRMPAGAEVFMVVAVEAESGESRRVATFVVRPEQAPGVDDAYRLDGDVYLRLLPVGAPERVSAQLWISAWGGWRRVALWPELDRAWPQVVGPTAAAVMTVYGTIHGPRD